MVIRLPHGNITAQFPNSPPPVKELAVTGGTGRYQDVDGQGTLIEANQAFLAMVGYDETSIGSTGDSDDFTLYRGLLDTREQGNVSARFRGHAPFPRARRHAAVEVSVE